MEELIKTFHIDGKLIIAQIINFLIVLFVLYRFAYKPLLGILNERTQTIEKSLDDAKKASQELENAEKTREEKIIQAKKDAKAILEEAQKMAEKNKEETIAKTKEETAKVISQAKEQIEAEKEKMIADVKKEIGGLVALATEKILGEKIDDKKQEELINKTLEEVNSK